MSDSTPPVNETTRCDPSNGRPVEGANRLPSSDPVVGTMMTVPLDQIQPYDRNPRQQPNRAYALIKASIEARGFRGVLPITRRPGETHYRIAEGGNTTLVILKALHQAGDPRFSTVPCRFEPWVSETETLIAHLVENDARDDLAFIDKAQALREARHLLEAELGTALSQRALANALTKRGYRLDHSAIARMDYTLDVLLPVIPQALRAGLGMPQVRRLRRLHNAAKSLWRAHGSAHEKRFERLFAEALARTDQPEWDFEQTQREVEAVLAYHLGRDERFIRTELNAGRSRHEPPQREVVATASVSGAVDAAGTAAGTRGALPSRIPTPASSDRRDAPDEDEMNEPTETPDALKASPSQGDGSATTPRSPLTGPVDPKSIGTRDSGGRRHRAEVAISEGLLEQHAAPTDLKSLRARAWVLATRLAERHGMGSLIKPLSGEGYGYLVTDVLTANRESEKGAQTALRDATLWWHLVACCEGSS
nr:hypothetical protein [Gammaproteobacteria bacterium]